MQHATGWSDVFQAIVEPLFNPHDRAKIGPDASQELLVALYKHMGIPIKKFSIEEN